MRSGDLLAYLSLNCPSSGIVSCSFFSREKENVNHELHELQREDFKNRSTSEVRHVLLREVDRGSSRYIFGGEHPAI